MIDRVQNTVRIYLVITFYGRLLTDRFVSRRVFRFSVTKPARYFPASSRYPGGEIACTLFRKLRSAAVKGRNLEYQLNEDDLVKPLIAKALGDVKFSYLRNTHSVPIYHAARG